MTTTLEIQRRLRALGFDPGPADGIRGRLTIRAIKAFQAERGLTADGIVGPITSRALFGAPARTGRAAPPTPEQNMPWFDEARRLIGVREIPGSASNPIIMDWAEDLDLHYSGDDVPWCGLFVAACMGSQLPDEPLPDNPFGARNWLKFGRTVEPIKGAVLVFWRGSKAGWKGHVGLYAGEDEATFHVLGGNQSDSVSVARIARNRLLGARWPLTAPIAGGRFFNDLAAAPGLSTNEA
jgi:uncharacterized protein (TIGR02594 family)